MVLDKNLEEHQGKNIWYMRGLAFVHISAKNSDSYGWYFEYSDAHKGQNTKIAAFHCSTVLTPSESNMGKYGQLFRCTKTTSKNATGNYVGCDNEC